MNYLELLMTVNENLILVCKDKIVKQGKKISVIGDFIGMNFSDTFLKEDDLYVYKEKYYSLKHFIYQDYDVYELKSSGMTLEEKVICYEEIIDKMSEGVILSDKDHNIVSYNPSIEQMERLSAKEIVGKKLWEAFDYSDENLSEHKMVFDSKEAIIDKYKAHTELNGIPQYTSYSTYPVINHGRMMGVFSIAKNETVLRNLLYETIELKRKLFVEPEKKPKSNENGARYQFSDILGEDQLIKDVIREAQTIALLDTPIVIVGETGTGKEMFAQSIHNFSRAKSKFVAINCAAIPENLLESILFGTVKGSYTGAMDKRGLFEEAGNGTLFLDEINSMSMMMQAKLLRVLQERLVRRVGSTETIPVECRIISAINEEPKHLIETDKMRQDLFFRLSGYSLYLPSLKGRSNDIYLLITKFIGRYNQLLGKNIKGMNSELTSLLLGYSWPGNIRELEHMVHNLMVKAVGNELTIEDIPSYLVDFKFKSDDDETLPNTLRKLEKHLIEKALLEHDGNITKTSRALGIIRQSLLYRIKKLDIKR
ncbi:PAS domain-containing protein [Acidaminobacter sp. JC074]|uniref:sigma-54 interaction domain-containing protein n=1 Tax=Acidaminobacter sp. JC074 TaxID=2530199 RepID=UPI001F10FADF|nr:sigma 54-interacting transcriptional regulator [Acidaminobacter sp. JC074]MCH4890175.1 PAS domain-containing protein [Acidaminobacter sp. JC074]